MVRKPIGLAITIKFGQPQPTGPAFKQANPDRALIVLVDGIDSRFRNMTGFVMSQFPIGETVETVGRGPNPKRARAIKIQRGGQIHIFRKLDFDAGFLIDPEDAGAGCCPDRAIGRCCQGHNLVAKVLVLCVGIEFSILQSSQSFGSCNPNYSVTILGKSVDVVFRRSCLYCITGEASCSVAQYAGAVSTYQ